MKYAIVILVLIAGGSAFGQPRWDQLPAPLSDPGFRARLLATYPHWGCYPLVGDCPIEPYHDAQGRPLHVCHCDPDPTDECRHHSLCTDEEDPR